LFLRESTRRKNPSQKERERERERRYAVGSVLGDARNEDGSPQRSNAPVVENVRGDGDSNLTESRRCIPTRVALVFQRFVKREVSDTGNNLRERERKAPPYSYLLAVFRHGSARETRFDGSDDMIAEMSKISEEKSINFQSSRRNQSRIRARFLAKLQLHAECK